MTRCAGFRTAGVLLSLAAWGWTDIGCRQAFGQSPIPGQPLEVVDSFFKDTLAEYKTFGEASWTPGAVRIPKGAGLARVATLDATVELAFDLWPKPTPDGEPCITRLTIAATNGWEVIVVIARGEHEGRIFRQVLVGEKNHGAAGNRSGDQPSIKQLRQLPPFSIPGDVERWTLKYHYGLLEFACEGRRVGTAFSGAFASWVQGVIISQDSGSVELSRYSLAGKHAGYTEVQRPLYEQTVRLRTEADAAWARGEVERALDLQRNCIPVMDKAFGKDDFSVGLVQEWIGHCYTSLNQHREAQAAYSEAARVYAARLGDNHPTTLANRAASVYEESLVSDRDAAERRLRPIAAALLDLAGPGSDYARAAADDLAAILIARAETYLEAGRYSDFAQLRAEVVDTLAPVTNPAAWHFKQARRDHDFAKELAAAEPARQAEMAKVRKLLQESNASIIAADAVRTKRLLQQTLDLSKSVLGEKHPITGETMAALAASEGNAGDYGAALALLEQSIAIHRQNPDYEHALAAALCGYGAALSQLGRHNEADDSINEAIQICDRANDHTTLYAECLLERGRNHIRAGNPELAEAALTLALKTYMNAGTPASMSALTARERLADLRRARGDLAGAEDLLDQQRQLVSGRYGGDSLPHIQILQTEAKHLMMASQFAAAVAKYQKALQAAARSFGKGSFTYRGILEGMIDAQAYSGDLDGAVKTIHEILDFEALRRQSLADAYPERLQIEQSLADQTTLGLLIQLAVRNKSPADEAYRHVLALKGAVIAHQRSVRIAASRPDLKPLVDRLRVLGEQITSRMLDRTATGSGQPLEALVAERDKIQTQLSRASATYRQTATPISVAELRASLPRGAVLVDYVEFARPPSLVDRIFGRPGVVELAAFIVSPTAETQLIGLGPVGEVDAAALAWLAAIEAESDLAKRIGPAAAAEATDAAGDALRKLIWDPLASQAGAASHALVAPVGVLVACPFAAMRSGDGRSYLTENAAFTYVTSPRLLVELSNREKSTERPRLVLVGNIDFDASAGAPAETRSNAVEVRAPAFKQLPAVEDEIVRIRGAFVATHPAQDVEQLMRDEATEQAIVDAAPRANFLHLGTHGFFISAGETSTQPEHLAEQGGSDHRCVFAGIAVAGANRVLESTNPRGGILWTDEIATLDLKNTELVVMSACQTALGTYVPGEGMLGTQRALQIAGAHSSLTSLWAVNDAATAELMARFYDNLWRRRMPKAQAIQRAQLDLLWGAGGAVSAQGTTGPIRLPPKYWAAFVLHGDGR